MRSLKWALVVGLTLIGSLAVGRPAAAQSGCTLTTTSVTLTPGDEQIFNTCPGETPPGQDVDIIDIMGTVVSRTLFCTSNNGGSLLVTTVNVNGFRGVSEITGHVFTGSQFSFTLDAGNGSPCSLVSTRVVNTRLVDTTTGHGFIAPLVFLLTTQPVNGVCTTTVVVDVDRSSAPICF